MAPYNRKSRNTVFRAFPPLEEGAVPAGYAALIAEYDLAVPAPDLLCAIGTKHRKRRSGRWRLFTPRHRPEDTLRGHLIFALRREGIDLFVLKALFRSVGPRRIADLARSQPTGAYSRRVWFLYEWLCGDRLDLDDAARGNFVPLVDDALQYPGPSRDSKRHRVRNNLPGVAGFCPMIRRTEKLDGFIAMDLSQAVRDHISAVDENLLGRAAALLMFDDAKASNIIEGESPPHSRIAKWGSITGDAGRRPISVEELERLQSVVIAGKRFVTPGRRFEGGFVGSHHRATGMPMPAHISARHEDLESLLSGLIETDRLLNGDDYHAVLAAAQIAFGFVFIHPFEDGNGRVHRYLLHHVLAEKGFVPEGLTLPISLAILHRLGEYRRALESYSKPRLNLIEWHPTDKGSVRVTGETIDLYRYFDATEQAEFLFECVEEAANGTLPEEIDFLAKHDLLRDFINGLVDMPDRLSSLLIRSLQQNDGRLSNRALRKEFAGLSEAEVESIENRYDEIFRA